MLSTIHISQRELRIGQSTLHRRKTTVSALTAFRGHRLPPIQEGNKYCESKQIQSLYKRCGFLQSRCYKLGW